MKTREEKISPILRFPAGANDGATSGNKRSEIAPRITNAEIQGSKR
jgi:hypothetical protein